MAPAPASSRRLAFDDNRLCALLFGQHHAHLARIEQRLPVHLIARGNELFVQGESDVHVEQATRVLQDLYGQLGQGREIGKAEIDAAIRLVQSPPSDAGDGGAIRPLDAAIKTERRSVVPRSANQLAYLRAMERHELVFALGPAGTGKTYLAVAAAVAMLKARRVDRLILSRPAVEAGERLGFLPGDMREKVDPYLRPLFDALQDMLPDGRLQRAMELGQIEIAPLAFMRGRTLSNAFVILDEAQNTTPAQMKMFLTRLGENSRMVVTGDPSQTDLPAGQPSGLADAVGKLAAVRAIGIVQFDRGDIVRHPLVTEILNAYDGVAADGGTAGHGGSITGGP